MRRGLALAAILGLAAVLWLSGCGGTPTGKLSGQVTSKTSGVPIEEVCVSAGAARDFTDSDGRFVIDEVDAGQQTIHVTARGYGRYTTTVDIKPGDNTLDVSLRDGSVRGIVLENATTPRPIRRARVRVAGRFVKLDGNRFETDNVPVGLRTVSVKAPGHQPYWDYIKAVPGENKLKVVLDLTVLAAAKRFEQDCQAQRYREAFEFVHPDVKARFTFARFVVEDGRRGIVVGDRYEKGEPDTGLQVFTPPQRSSPRSAFAFPDLAEMSMTFAAYPESGGVVTSVFFDINCRLGKWRPSYSDQTYYWVVVVERTLNVHTELGDCFVRQPNQHWQQIDGRWYIIFDWH